MSEAGKKRGLGRGLSALMDDVGMDTIIDVEPTKQPAKKPTKKKAAKKTTTKTTTTKKPVKKKATPKKPVAKKASSKSTNTKSTTTKPTTTGPDSPIAFVAIDQLTRNPDQPRRYFDKDMLEELTQSIKDKGVLQPVLVRPLPDSAREKLKGGQAPAYQIIAGERRWQAALKAGLSAIPVFVREINDREALEIGIVENVHRADLNPIEEAMAYKSLFVQFERTQEDVATAVGKSRSYVTNQMRLLNLPDSVQTYLAQGKITTGHARALIPMEDPAAIAEAIVANDLSVRDVEKLAWKLKNADKDPGLSKAVKDQKAADVRRVEQQLSDALGLVVDLRDKGGRGEIRLKYRKPDQLEAVIKRLLS